MTNNTITAPNDPTPLRPSITLAPGALDDVPLVALTRFLADHGLVLAGTRIEKGDGVPKQHRPIVRRTEIECEFFYQEKPR